LGDVDGDGDGYVCLSRTRHLSAREKAFESHYDPSPSTPTEASETKNVKGKSRPAPERARAPIVFDRRFWTTPGIFDPPATMEQLSNFQTLPPKLRMKRLHRAYGEYQRELPPI